MAYQCILCRQPLREGDRGVFKLDPTALIVVPRYMADGGAPDTAAREEQVFYCHFACFRSLVADDSRLHFTIPGASRPAPTSGEMPPFTGEGLQERLDRIRGGFKPEDLPMLDGLLDRLSRDLERHGERAGVWDKLLAYPRGRWVALAALVAEDDLLYPRIAALDAFISPREDILVTWVDDYYNRTRPFENNRVVLLALDSGYQWLRQLIIPIERPDRPNPGLIP